MSERGAGPPDPPDGCPVPVWVVVVTTTDDDDGFEVAAVFTDHLDAGRYAAWWNSEEIRRRGAHPAARAVTEEIDFYPTGTWRQPRASRALMRLYDAEHGNDRRSTH